MKHLLLSLAILAAGSAAAQETAILTADKHNEYGLEYTLPKTALQVTLYATQRVERSGPYAQYAKRFLGTDKVITANSVSWTLDSLTVTPYGVPDADARYLMQLKAGALTYLCVAPDRMLLAINSDVSAPTTPAMVNFTGQIEEMPEKGYLQYVTDDFLASRSEAKQAQMLSESLMEVRDAKLALTRGTADNMPTDGRQLELMLNSLADQEATMTRAFMGYSAQTTAARTFTFIPEAEEGESAIICRFSDFAGFVAADDLSGAPVYIKVSDVKIPELPKDQNGVTKTLPKDAVIYAIPGEAKVSLTMDGRTLYSKVMEFGQYRETFGLNPKLFTDKKAPSAAIFNPVTGALEKLMTVSPSSL